MADGDNAADSLAPGTLMCDQRFGSVGDLKEWGIYDFNWSQTWQHQHKLPFGPH